MSAAESQSGYYAWLARSPSQREVADDVLTTQIRDAFDANRKVYGSTPSCATPTYTSAANVSPD